MAKKNMNEAEAVNRQIRETLDGLKETEIAAFVDGSYDVSREESGFGAIIVEADGTEHILSKGFTRADAGEEFIHTRNVAAELQGVMEAVSWAVSHDKTKITVFYDYTGIEEWAMGRWQAKNSIPQGYVQFIFEKRSQIHIEFVKVPAHSGVEYNERADALARQAISSLDCETSAVEEANPVTEENSVAKDNPVVKADFVPDRAYMVKEAISEFSRIQNWMTAIKGSNEDVYHSMHDRYLELKTMLASLGVDLAEIDKIKE